jgi:hypothetical protein
MFILLFSIKFNNEKSDFLKVNLIGISVWKSIILLYMCCANKLVILLCFLLIDVIYIETQDMTI